MKNIAKRGGKVMYLGKELNSSGGISYKYAEIDNDNKRSSVWSFSKKIFKKGTIGSIYDCEFEDDIIIYKKGAVPTSYVEEKGKLVSTHLIFPELYRKEELSRQVDVAIRNSKKPETILDVEIKNLKSLYKALPSSKRSSFIGNLVFKITN